MKFMLQAYNLGNNQVAQFCEHFYGIKDLIAPIVIIRPQTAEFIQDLDLLKSSFEDCKKKHGLITGLMTIMINPNVDVESKEDISVKYVMDHYFDYDDAVMCQFCELFEVVMEDDREMIIDMDEMDMDYDD